MLYPDNAEEMVFETEDIIKHNGMPCSRRFAV